MDSGSLATLAQQAMTVLQPYWPVIAMKAAGKAGEQLPQAVKSLWQAIKNKFDTDVAVQRALERLLTYPGNGKFQNMLEGRLLDTLEDDEHFAETLKEMLAFAEPSPTSYQAASGGSAISQGAGSKAVATGGTLIEGGIGGDVNIGGASQRKKEDKE